MRRPPIRIVDDDVIRIVDDDDVEVPDGHTVRVRTSVMDDMMVVRRPTFDAADLADHQPGYRDEARALEAYRRSCEPMGQSMGQSPVSAADARAARSEWIADMTSAWKTDARKRQPDPDELPDDGDDDEVEGSRGQYNRQYKSRRKIGQTALPFESHADARTARDEYVRKLCDAWRTPVGDAAEPDLGSRPDDPRAPPGVTDPGAAASLEERVEATRGRIWNDYKARLESAWRAR
jgi:hypothetical protein